MYINIYISVRCVRYSCVLYWLCPVMLCPIHQKQYIYIYNIQCTCMYMYIQTACIYVYMRMCIDPKYGTNVHVLLTLFVYMCTCMHMCIDPKYGIFFKVSNQYIP